MNDYDLAKTVNNVVNNYYEWLSDKLGIKVDIDVLEKLIEEEKLQEEYTLARYLDTLLPKPILPNMSKPGYFEDMKSMYNVRRIKT